MQRLVDVLADADLLGCDGLTEPNGVKLLADLELGRLERRLLLVAHGADFTPDGAEGAVDVSLWSTGCLDIGAPCERVVVGGSLGALVDRLEGESTRGTGLTLVLKPLRKLFEILFKLVIFLLIVL